MDQTCFGSRGFFWSTSNPLFQGRRPLLIRRADIGGQDRKRVAGGQDYEVRYEAKKTGRSKAAVKKAVKKVGTSRKKVERRLAR
jgi:hypothetical protein